VDSPEAPVAILPVIVVADDLIWASRLGAAVERAGTKSLMARSADELARALQNAPAKAAVIVDLNGRAYDGVDAVRVAGEAGHRVLAVGQHQDIELRRRALAAGARRVFSYNKLFADGPAVVTALIEGRL
jgi:DNA-binding NtrC family response regulator